MSDELKVVQGEYCRHLLSKGLFVNDGLPGEHLSSEESNYWCGKSQTIYGPDDRLCGSKRCLISTRDCYEAP